jgi:hypothetical protein
MSMFAFVAPGAMLSSFTGKASSVASRSAQQPQVSQQTPRASLNLVPGIPPGEDPLENAPLRYYVPRPTEDYSQRGFATLLPQTWAGEAPTIGAFDIDQSLTKEKIEDAKFEPVDVASSGAFVDFARMMQEERKIALAKFDKKEDIGGRPTCGESEGRGIVSNYRKELVEGVKCVEYWGTNYGLAE